MKGTQLFDVRKKGGNFCIFCDNGKNKAKKVDYFTSII